jgi:hypothetical protein
MSGVDFTSRLPWKALPDRLALKPYWGKLTVRNFRGAMETSASFEARLAPLLYSTTLSEEL